MMTITFMLVGCWLELTLHFRSKDSTYISCKGLLTYFVLNFYCMLQCLLVSCWVQRLNRAVFSMQMRTSIHENDLLSLLNLLFFHRMVIMISNSTKGRWILEVKKMPIRRSCMFLAIL
ncbi:hypothetical protein T09_3010 [Trichinella sp. T9]|nr:hypothetical protein T09_3010 [Trichinella sp. T9]